MKTSAFVATIKPTLDSSVYKGIKHGYRIKINYLISFEAKITKRNIKMSYISITNIEQIKFCPSLSFKMFGPFRKFQELTTGQFHFLP
jgi:hypothetical protein